MLALERMRYMANQRSERLATEFQRALSEILRMMLRSAGRRAVQHFACGAFVGSFILQSVLNCLWERRGAKEAFLAVQRATPFIKRQLGNKVRMRKLPELKFILDDSIAYSVRIGQLIDQLNSEKKCKKMGGSWCAKSSRNAPLFFLPATGGIEFYDRAYSLC